VPLDDLGTDEQPETGAGNRADRIRAETALEHMGSGRRRNTDAVVANRDASLGRRRADVNDDRAALRRVLDRVVDEVLHHPLNAPLVVIGDDWHVRHGAEQRMVPTQRLHLFHGGRDRAPQVSATALKCDRLVVPVKGFQVSERFHEVTRLIGG